jgi:hypothetical protein
MMMSVNEVMANYDTNITNISKKSGISKTTLSNAFKRPINTWTIRILNGVATAINESPEKLLHLLQGDQYSLTIDDQARTIQGVKIPDPATYQNIKFTVKSNVMEGWQPSCTDIEELKAFAETSHPELGQKFKEIFGD